MNGLKMFSELLTRERNEVKHYASAWTILLSSTLTDIIEYAAR